MAGGVTWHCLCFFIFFSLSMVDAMRLRMLRPYRGHTHIQYSMYMSLQGLLGLPGVRFLHLRQCMKADATWNA